MRFASPGKRLGWHSARVIAAPMAAAFLLASCTSAASSRGAASAPSGGGVMSLTTVSALKSQFNRDDGHPRLVLLFSPT